MTTDVIAFRTLSQKILFDCEISGQLSDGVWENATPHNHWRRPTDATVVVNPDRPGLSFYPRIAYRFANKMLLECCSLRMINYVKFYTTFPHLLDHPKLSHHDVQIETICDFVNETRSFLEGEPKPNDRSWVYYYQQAVRVMNALEVVTPSELALKLLPVVSVPYDAKMLKEDLQEMSKVFNDARTGEVGLIPSSWLEQYLKRS